MPYWMLVVLEQFHTVESNPPVPNSAGGIQIHDLPIGPIEQWMELGILPLSTVNPFGEQSIIWACSPPENNPSVRPSVDSVVAWHEVALARRSHPTTFIMLPPPSPHQRNLNQPEPFPPECQHPHLQSRPPLRLAPSPPFCPCCRCCHSCDAVGLFEPSPNQSLTFGRQVARSAAASPPTTPILLPTENSTNAGG